VPCRTTGDKRPRQKKGKTGRGDKNGREQHLAEKRHGEQTRGERPKVHWKKRRQRGGEGERPAKNKPIVATGEETYASIQKKRLIREKVGFPKYGKRADLGNMSNTSNKVEGSRQ